MEKGTPHYRLSVIKELVGAGVVRTTYAARAGANALGLTFADMVDTILTLESTDFYKSMTTYADHRIWQDVYRPQTIAGSVYLKLTVIDAVLIVSFKELSS